MNSKYLEETKMLNFNSKPIQKLVRSRNWKSLDEYNQIKEIYGFVQNEIRFGYNKSDVLSAEQVLFDGYGQCNTKATLLMALLRGVGIACRIHGFVVSKDFQRGPTTAIISAFAPRHIIHTWVEVCHNGQWLALEGVITDKKYFESVKRQYADTKGEFKRFAIATNNLLELSIDWNGQSTFVQKAAIEKDFGVFDNPDIFFEKYMQRFGTVRNFLYSNIVRKIMNRNVEKIRRGVKGRCLRIGFIVPNANKKRWTK